MAGHGMAHDDDEPEIHMPAPSFSPALIALGVTIACFGLLSTPVLIAAGALVFGLGLATWLIDDARSFAQHSDHIDVQGGGH